LDYASDDDNFASVSLEEGHASQVLALDRRAGAHELELGLALGYPVCCCERIASIGEANIDHYAAGIAQWTFAGPYRRINPVGYKSGLALISHLPCSQECRKSLTIAEHAREFVTTYRAERLFCSLASSPLLEE
jgi:hypothetical protein